LKASALIDAIVREDVVAVPAPEMVSALSVNDVAVKKEKNVLLVDHEDSFVHTLANYLRQTGQQPTASHCI
jgi:anthranilate synthase